MSNLINKNNSADLKSARDERFMVAIHRSNQGIVLVISDTDLIGKKFETDNLQLDLRDKFYLGEEIDKCKLSEKIEGSNSVHITGRKSVEFVHQLGLIDKNKILVIEGIPHAELYLG